MIRFKAAVAGLGGIGLGYDLAHAGGARVQTHCRAFAEHPGFELIGGADPNPDARDGLVRGYSVPAYSTLEEMLNAGSPDIVSIAAGTDQHRPLVEAALAARPRAVLCEKPLASTLADAEWMVDAAEKAGTLLVVNYIRRFDPGVLHLRNRIRAGEFGDIYRGVVWYSKGLANNGSHYLDLLNFLLGDAQIPRMLDSGRTLPNGDVEPDFRVSHGSTDVYFLSGRHEHFSHGGFDLLGTSGRLQYDSGGRDVRTWKVAIDQHFPGYRTLRECPNMGQVDVKRYQWHVVDALYGALTAGTPVVSTGATALHAMRTIGFLLSEMRTS